MSGEGRRMIYPVTLSQKIKYFPFRFLWKHMPMFRTIFLALGISIPVFYSLEKLSYTPANVAKYETYMRAQEKEHKEHLHHLEGYYGEKHH